MVRFDSRLKSVSLALSAIAIFVGITVLFGWTSGLEILKSFIPGYITMKPNTAACFIAEGLAVAALLDVFPRRVRTAILVVALSTVALLAGGTGIEYLFAADLKIDQLFFRDYVQFPYPGRMAQITMFNFLVGAVGIAALAISEKLMKVFHASAVLIGLSSSLAIAGYIFGVPVLYGSIRYTSMAFHTGFGFLVLSGAMLFARPQSGFMRVISSHGPGGTLARMFLPVSVFVPLVLGIVVVKPYVNFGNIRFGIVLLVLSCSILFVFGTWLLALRIENVESGRLSAVNETETQFRNLANAIPQLCWMANADGYITWYNSRWYEYTGTTPEDMEGWGWQSVHDPAMLPSVLERWKASIATGQPFEMVFPLRGADGVFRPFLTRVNPVKDAHGAVVRWFGTNTDISAQKQLEEESERRRQVLETLVKEAPAAIVMLDRNMRYVRASRRWLNEMGLGDFEIHGKSHYDLFPNLTEEWKEAHRRGLAGEESSGEENWIAADGSKHYIRWEIHPWGDSGAETGGIIIAHDDLTKEKQIEAALRESEGILRTVTDHASVGLIMLDRNRRYVYANEYYIRVLRLPIADIIGKPISEVLAPAYDQISPRLDRVYAGQGGTYELCMPQKDGSADRYYSVALEPRWDDGKVIGVIAMVIDITEAKRAELVVRASEEKFSKAFAASPDVMVITNASDGTIREVNGSYEHFFGVNRNDVVGTKGTWLGIHADAEVGEQALQEFKKQGRLGEYALRVLDGHGKERMTLCSAEPIELAGEAHVLTIMRDVTESRKSEDALKERARLLDLSFDAIIVRNENDRISYWNEGAVEAYGYSREEALGRSPHELMQTRFPAPLAEIIQVLEEEGRWAGELVHTRKDGSEITVSSRWAAEYDAQGKLCSILETNTDITERKQAEDALRKSEQRYRKLFGEMQESMFVSEAVYDDSGRPVDFRIVQVNPAFEKHSGRPYSGLIGKTIRQLFPEAEQEWIDLYAKVVKTGEPQHVERYSKTSRRWLDLTSYRPQPGQVAVMFSDITARRLAEQELRKLNQELEDRVRHRTAELETTNKELESFSYSVSHDLRGPLRTINGFSQALLEDHSASLDHKAAHYLRRIMAAADRMGEIIDALLQLSRLTRAQIDVKPVDLSELAGQVVDDLRQGEPDRNVEVRIEPGLMAKGDPRLLSVALQNLLSNAWKFTSKREDARIEFGRENGTFFVRDNGAGFDMRYAGQLFRAFHRMHSDQEFKGSGIGLATVRRILLRHHGNIWVEAEEGKGATFRFEIPT